MDTAPPYEKCAPPLSRESQAEAHPGASSVSRASQVSAQKTGANHSTGSGQALGHPALQLGEFCSGGWVCRNGAVSEVSAPSDRFGFRTDFATVSNIDWTGRQHGHIVAESVDATYLP